VIYRGDLIALCRLPPFRPTAITGARQSGVGLEQTQHGLEEFTQLSIIIA
jgi:hypothetical protein